MDGRCRKIDVSCYAFVGGGGIYCNNEKSHLIQEVMKEKFGKPNGNCLRADESTWKYVLEYRGIYLTVYDYMSLWSVGFLEQKDIITDYELMYAVSRMLFDYLKEEFDMKLNEKESVLV